jgi:hypothetical protein
MLPASVAKFNAKRAGLKILPIKLATVYVAIVTVKNHSPARQQGYLSTASATWRD